MNTTQEEQILAAAYTCISRGYGNISLRQIAQEAGVAVSQISYHFKNKEGLPRVIAQAAHKYHHLMQATIAEYQSPEEKGERLISLLKRPSSGFGGL